MAKKTGSKSSQVKAAKGMFKGFGSVGAKPGKAGGLKGGKKTTKKTRSRY